MIAQETLDLISDDFKKSIPKIFGDNLVFAFICGGFAKGYANHDHDIDVFICLEKNDDHAYDRYVEWYLDLHKRFGFPPDLDYPGEVVVRERLLSILSVLTNFRIKDFVVTDVWLKKAIIWADMLAGRILAEHGNGLAFLKGLRIECLNYPDRWKADILELLPDDEKIKWRNIPQLLLMEHFMVYPKHDKGKHRVIC
jgi:predicted nucleotidyltransferase